MIEQKIEYSGTWRYREAGFKFNPEHYSNLILSKANENGPHAGFIRPVVVWTSFSSSLLAPIRSLLHYERVLSNFSL